MNPSQMSEESEHKIGMMESSLNRFGLMLESIQTDVMQINEETKELTMYMETIHQKLHAHDNSVQTVVLMVTGCGNKCFNQHVQDLRQKLDFDLFSLLPVA